MLYKVRYELWVAALLGTCRAAGACVVIHPITFKKLEIVKNGGNGKQFMLSM